MSSSKVPAQSETYESSESEHASPGGLFEKKPMPTAVGKGASPVKSPPPIRTAGVAGGLGAAGITRAAPAVAQRVGRGPIPVDPRKFRYDRNRANALPALEFGASRVDRMDASDAGDMLERIHVMFGIDRESEDILAAFDKALFFEHTINGASLLQSGRGTLSVGLSEFDLAPLKRLLGVDQRRFFRAFADEIASVNREVLGNFDPYSASTVEKHGQLMQVAVERGLQKFPHLAHDSSDAGLLLSVEERVALMASKRLVLPTVVNKADQLHARAPVSSAASASQE